ncbi:hypothetical protein HPB47_027268, partial [Ixodes persulcatus]
MTSLKFRLMKSRKCHFVACRDPEERRWDDRGRLMRRTIMRYANLSSVITLRCISPPVKKRFPTLDHLVDAGLLLGSEREVFEQLKTNHSTYWMPLVWASSVASRARKEGRIRDDFALKTIVDVTTLAVYTFFLATLFGSQGLDPNAGYKGHEIDLYVPIFNFLRFFFYMGWLKVAETLVNPFGEDDDDFEMNWVIDRNIQTSRPSDVLSPGRLPFAEDAEARRSRRIRGIHVSHGDFCPQPQTGSAPDAPPPRRDVTEIRLTTLSRQPLETRPCTLSPSPDGERRSVSYLVVDEMHQNHPELLKDQYWNEVMPPELPYTLASRQFYCFPHQGSTACMIIPPNKASFVSRDKLPANTPLRGAQNEKPWAGMFSRFLSRDSSRQA